MTSSARRDERNVTMLAGSAELLFAAGSIGCRSGSTEAVATADRRTTVAASISPHIARVFLAGKSAVAILKKE